MRLYDFNKNTDPWILSRNNDIPNHKNRIFASKFRPDHPEIAVTCGWDCYLLIWDMRAKHSVGFINGPMVCGDALDCKAESILTGSWRTEK